MRKTKIICTIGPACDNEETLTAMCVAGMNVARLNFSHGTHEEHLKRIELIRRVREKLNLPIAIMLDTKGPEYRIRTFKNGAVTLRDGGSFTLTVDDVEGDENRVSVSYKKPRMTEYLFRKRNVKSHEHDRPVDCMESQDVLSDEMHVCRPVLFEAFFMISHWVVSEEGYVV